MNLYHKICPYCGKEFITDRDYQIYCSSKCKAKKMIEIHSTPEWKQEHRWIIEKGEPDLKIIDILHIMSLYNITYPQYINDRASYVDMYYKE